MPQEWERGKKIKGRHSYKGSTEFYSCFQRANQKKRQYFDVLKKSVHGKHFRNYVMRRGENRALAHR